MILLVRFELSNIKHCEQWTLYKNLFKQKQHKLTDRLWGGGRTEIIVFVNGVYLLEWGAVCFSFNKTILFLNKKKRCRNQYVIKEQQEFHKIKKKKVHDRLVKERYLLKNPLLLWATSVCRSKTKQTCLPEPDFNFKGGKSTLTPWQIAVSEIRLWVSQVPACLLHWNDARCPDFAINNILQENLLTFHHDIPVTEEH